jgi:hypothetical protein
MTETRKSKAIQELVRDLSQKSMAEITRIMKDDRYGRDEINTSIQVEQVAATYCVAYALAAIHEQLEIANIMESEPISGKAEATTPTVA